MSFAFVQERTIFQASSLAFSSNNTAGNLLVAGVFCLTNTNGGSGFTITGFSGAHNTWVEGPSLTGGGAGCGQFWYCLSCTGGVAESVSATFSPLPGAYILIAEYSNSLGNTTLDVANENQNPNGASGNVLLTTNFSNELGVCMSGAAVTGQVVSTVAAGWTKRTSTQPPALTDFVGMPSGSQTGGVTWNGNSGVMNFIAGFYAAVFSISGNAGVADANVAYSGTSSGNVTADGSGNYTISNLSNGSYTITPSLVGYTFNPVSANETISGSSITGVNFIAAAGGYSVPDCRISYCGLVPTTNLYPNGNRTVNGTKIYDVEASNNLSIPGVDSRAAGVPIASGTYPKNSRTPGTFGPGE